MKTIEERQEFDEVAPHNYRSNGYSRDPECRVCGGKWAYEEHPDVIKEKQRERGQP